MQPNSKRATKKLSANQKEILVGLLLGDACLETQTKGQTWRLLIEHGKKQKEYLEYKYKIFQEFVQTPPKQRIKQSSQAGGKTTMNWNFKTTVQPSLRFYAHQFYQTNPDGTFTKKVPKQIAKWLTPQGLAYWYMDDGSMKSKTHKAVYLNTQGFEKQDCELLCKVLKDKFDLECKLKKSIDKRTNKVSYQVAIAGKATYDKLRDLIFPYFLPSMHYKFPPARLLALPKGND